MLFSRHTIFSLVFFVFNSQIFAEEKTLDLDVNKAIRMALAKNFSIELERFEPQKARERELTAKGRFDPDFELSFRRSEDTTRDQFVRDERGDGRRVGFNSINQGTVWSAGVNGVTQWGLGYEVGLETNEQSGTFNGFDDDISTTGVIGITQPLLRGFGPAANLAGVRIARNNVQASEWQLKQQAMQIITEVISVYNELYFSKENLLVATRSRELARQLLQDNIKRVEIGVKTPLDVTTARAEVASREDAVLQAQRDIKDRENFLKQLLTRDMLELLNTSVAIAPPISPGPSKSVLAGVAEALEHRPDYRQTKLEIENRNITLAFEKNQKLPRLDLVASMRMLGFDDDYGTSAKRVGARDQSGWSAGAIFSVPLGNREARGRVNAAQLDAAQSLLSLQRLEQLIIVEVDNAAGAISTSRKRIEATAEARKLALESMQAGDSRLVAGTGTTFELLELQKKLTEAETAELRARADYNRALAAFHFRTGTTLKVHGVTVE